jgi:hypothetical protein
MKLSEITGIGRTLDPKIPSNFAIVGLSVLVAILFGVFSLLTGSQLITAFVAAFRVSVIFFLGWAIAREFDPDHPYSAFVAAIAILATTFAGFQSNLLFLVFLLLMLRYITQSTGVAATLVDLSLGFFLTIWLSWSMDWIVGLLGAAAYALDALHEEEKTTRLVFAGLSLITAITAALTGSSGTGFAGLQANVALISAALIIIALPLYFSYTVCTSVGDFTNERLDPQRIRLAQVFYIGSIILIGIKEGLQVSKVLLAAASVSAATGIYYLLNLAFRKLKSESA